jgi:CRISPR-associated protein Cmr3
MTSFLSLYPHDPIIARDGRPFGAGQGHRMRSLKWPYPSVLAGSVRTLIGKCAGGTFDAKLVAALKESQVAGPFPLLEGELYFPSPLDFVLRRDPDACYALRPCAFKENEDWDLATAHPKLLPCMLPNSASEDFKPADPPAFWSTTQFTSWLLNSDGEKFPVPPEGRKPASGYLPAPDTDQRMHVCIDSDSGAAKETLLYMTSGLALDPAVRLAARVRLPAPDSFPALPKDLDAFHSFGGERRLVRFRAEPTNSWNSPPDIVEALGKAPRVRMVLATPAIFSHGWRPGWLDDALEGSPPGSGVKLRLAGACVGRWRPVSGWSLEQSATEKPGPKALRRLAPAGSVYFFDVVTGDARQLAENLWLEPVSDSAREGREGFGLALWGVWNEFSEGTESCQNQR